MAITFGNSVINQATYKSFAKPEQTVKTPVQTQTQGEIAAFSVVPPKAKKGGFLQGIMDKLAGLHKVNAYAKGYTSGVVNGAVNAVATGTGLMGIAWVLKRVSNHEKIVGPVIRKAGETVTKVAKGVINLPKKTIGDIAKGIALAPYKMVKSVIQFKGVGKVGKLVALTGGAIAFAATLLKAKIGINKATADIDHGYYIGHRNK